MPYAKDSEDTRSIGKSDGKVADSMEWKGWDSYEGMAADIQNMEHDELVDLLESYDSDLLASDLEEMDVETLALMLSLYLSSSANSQQVIIDVYWRNLRS